MATAKREPAGMVDCAHCGGSVNLEHLADGAGHKRDGKAWCSEVCRQIVVDGKWPSPVGPATHDEMVAWMEEEAKAQRRAERADGPARRRREALAAVVGALNESDDLLDSLAKRLGVSR